MARASCEGAYKRAGDKDNRTQEEGIMNEPFLSNIFSCVGALFLLIGVMVRKKDLLYGFLNFMGGGFLVVAAVFVANVGFIVLNTIWMGIGLKIFIKGK